MANSEAKEVPSIASEAVLIRSEKMPADTLTVKGIHSLTFGSFVMRFYVKH